MVLDGQQYSIAYYKSSIKSCPLTGKKYGSSPIGNPMKGSSVARRIGTPKHPI
jgi:hypothetical protein